MVVNQLLDFTHEMNSATVILTVVVRVITYKQLNVSSHFFKQVDDDNKKIIRYILRGAPICFFLLSLDTKNNGFTN